MKIALVSPYDTAHPGGVYQHVEHLAEELRRRGHEVHVIGPSSARTPHAASSPFVHHIGRPVPIPANGSVARIDLSVRGYAHVRAILREHQFDVIHLHEPLVPALPINVLRYSTSTNVGTFHAYRRSNFAYFYAQYVLKPFHRRLDGLIAVSEAARDFVAEFFPGDYDVIPNGIDYERFAAPRPATGMPRDTAQGPTVLFVGRFERRKGLKYLLRAWARVREQAPNARLVVVGTGRSLPRYRSFVQRHEWTEVDLVGYVDDTRLVQLYHEADIFCAPSTGQESFGIVLLEAMASGTAIVASRIPGYSEVVADGREGLLVEPKNERALAAGLLRLLQDQELRDAMGRAGQAKAYDYRWEAVTDRVLACYERAMAHRAVRAVPERGRFRAVRRAAAEMAHLLAR